MNRPNDALKNAMKASPFVLFLRTFLLYQMLRFVLVNLRMLTMIWKSHG
jgi:hypothetical protein